MRDLRERSCAMTFPFGDSARDKRQISAVDSRQRRYLLPVSTNRCGGLGHENMLFSRARPSYFSTERRVTAKHCCSFWEDTQNHSVSSCFILLICFLGRVEAKCELVVQELSFGWQQVPAHFCRLPGRQCSDTVRLGWSWVLRTGQDQPPTCEK